MKISLLIVSALILLFQFANIQLVTASPMSTDLIAGVVAPPVEKTKKDKKNIRQEQKKAAHQQKRSYKKKQKKQNQFFKQHKTNSKGSSRLRLGLLFLTISLIAPLVLGILVVILAISTPALFSTIGFFVVVAIVSLALFVISILAIVYLILGMTNLDKEYTGSNKRTPLWIIGFSSIMTLLFSSLLPTILSAAMVFPIAGWAILAGVLFLAAIIAIYVTAKLMLDRQEEALSIDRLKGKKLNTDRND